MAVNMQFLPELLHRECADRTQFTLPLRQYVTRIEPPDKESRIVFREFRVEVAPHGVGAFALLGLAEYTEFGNFYGPRETEILGGLAEKLRRLQCDAVITGIGA